ncbi:MAG TPA: RNA methyltransferase [Bauldia sp.]|nr:RNA methyltransferase [Bauldia sp.]
MKRPFIRPRRTGAPRFAPQTRSERQGDGLFIYGLHPALAALANPRRQVKRILATRNAVDRLTAAGAVLPIEPEDTDPRALDRLLGGEAVHQGVALEVAPLDNPPLSSLAEARLVVVLDQVTDPHNVGAVMRSAVAFDADAIIVTARHAPAETGVLAKAASGALDLLPVIAVQNLARALAELAEFGFTRVGLAEDAPMPIEEAIAGERIAIVLGAEGKGLRHLTRQTCDRLARLTTSTKLGSLNVSNAAVLALYLARRSLGPAAGKAT